MAYHAMSKRRIVWRARSIVGITTTEREERPCTIIAGQPWWRSVPPALRGVGLLRRLMPATTTKHRPQLIGSGATANSANPQVCEGKRLAMEADERAYNNMVAATSRGVGTANVNIQNR
jgi:hypothetical protein